MTTNYDFQWDPQKAQSNGLKHGVNFEEAASVFLDPRALTIYDLDHSRDEDRWITLGVSKDSRLLLVCHTFQQKSPYTATIRIFSSRKGTKKEIHLYGEQQ